MSTFFISNLYVLSIYYKTSFYSKLKNLKRTPWEINGATGPNNNCLIIYSNHTSLESTHAISMSLILRLLLGYACLI